MIRHIGIVTTNLEQMIDFYCGLSGLQVILRADETSDFIDKILGLKKIKLTTVKLGIENKVTIELLKFDNKSVDITAAKKVNQTGITHISINVKDIKNSFDFIKKKNCNFISEPSVNNAKTAIVMFCCDPDGNLIELVETI